MAEIRGRISRSVILLALAAAATPAAWAQKVNVETDGSLDFTKARRYQWRDHPLADKDPVMKEATVAKEVIRSRMNEQLMGRGFKPVEHDPDFYVTYFVSGTMTQDLKVISAVGTTSWYGWGSDVYYSGWVKYGVDQQIDGFLILDFVNAKTLQLAWRAYCRDTITDMKNRTDNITRAVDKAMNKFPPKPRR